MQKRRIAELTQKIIAGYRVRREDDRSMFMDAPLEELQEGAHRLQQQFCGNHIDLCTIVNGRARTPPRRLAPGRPAPGLSARAGPRHRLPA